MYKVVSCFKTNSWHLTAGTAWGFSFKSCIRALTNKVSSPLSPLAGILPLILTAINFNKFDAK
jgi:hypothetical protein